MTFLDKSLRDFLSQLAARTPTPGGGTVAALNAALGTALVSMAARFTSGKKYVEVEAEAARVAETCDRLRERAGVLADEDSAAYDAVTAAYGLPKTNEAEKAARSRAIETAMGGALAVPRRTLALALEALELAAAFAPKANPNLASDVLVGAACLVAAAEGARANVRINALSLPDSSDAKKSLAEADAGLARAGELLSAVRAAVEGGK